MATAGMTYQYSSRSIQFDKTLYMYSAIGGREFIEAYLSSRADVIKRVCGKVDDRPIEKLPPVSLTTIDAIKEDIDTKEISAACLRCCGHDREMQHVHRWAEFFIRKFELSRRLCAGYSPALKGIEPEADLLTYCMVADLVARCATTRTVEGLRLLNGLLKMIDLICFKLEDPVVPAIAALLVSAIHR